jgi:CRISPR-associated protein Cmr2
VFVGYGDTPKEAQRDLETRKLSRDWTAINWIGESSSISGVDAIAYPRLEAADQNPNKTDSLERELKRAKRFWEQLSEFYNQETGQTAEGETGKFISPNERLSIPELVKRLITSTKDPIIGNFVTKNGLENLESFSDMIRKTDDGSGHWTGWFMGDGDKFGDRLNELACGDSVDNRVIEKNLDTFSRLVREWSGGKPNSDRPEGIQSDLQKFQKSYNSGKKLGRIIYSGGDDFLGAIYSEDPKNPIPPSLAIKWLKKLDKSWRSELQEKINKELGQYLFQNEDKEQKKQRKGITMSVGFVWTGHSVPQRDVLQHCREAEKKAKSAGRDRVTIRVVFNSGQYVEWITPWEYLNFLDDYTDLDGKTKEEANWSHVYGDLMHLSSRYALGLGNSSTSQRKNFVGNPNETMKTFFDFVQIYFPHWLKKNFLDQSQKTELLKLQKLLPNSSSGELYLDVVDWLKNAITIGWYFYGSNGGEHGF